MKLNTIKRVYDALNETVFAGLLYRPIIWNNRNRHMYAAYEAGITVPSIISVNLRHINGNNVRSIVYHEMIHQYLEEYLNIEEKIHHGPIFWKHYRKFAPKDVELFEELD